MGRRILMNCDEIKQTQYENNQSQYEYERPKTKLKLTNSNFEILETKSNLTTHEI